MHHIFLEDNGAGVHFRGGDVFYFKMRKRQIDIAMEIIVPRLAMFLVPKLIKEIRRIGYQMGNLRLTKTGLYFKTKRLIGHSNDEQFLVYGAFSIFIDDEMIYISANDGQRFKVAIGDKGMINLCLLPMILIELGHE